MNSCVTRIRLGQQAVGEEARVTKGEFCFKGGRVTTPAISNGRKTSTPLGGPCLLLALTLLGSPYSKLLIPIAFDIPLKKATGLNKETQITENVQISSVASAQ